MSFSHALLSGKAALVTGGGTGICRGIASRACGPRVRRRGHQPQKRPPRADGAGNQVAGPAVPSLSRRRPRPFGVETAVARTAAELGRLDVLVNGAAGNFLCLAENLSPNAFGTVVDIDLKGTFHVPKAALPHLKKSRGVVLNISATLQYLGTPARFMYRRRRPASMRSRGGLAVEWGAHGIRVNGDRARSHRRNRRCLGGSWSGRPGIGLNEENERLWVAWARESRTPQRGIVSLLERRIVRHRCHPRRRRRALACVELDGRGVRRGRGRL